MRDSNLAYNFYDIAHFKTQSKASSNGRITRPIVGISQYSLNMIEPLSVPPGRPPSTPMISLKYIQNDKNLVSSATLSNCRSIRAYHKTLSYVTATYAEASALFIRASGVSRLYLNAEGHTTPLPESSVLLHLRLRGLAFPLDLCTNPFSATKSCVGTCPSVALTQHSHVAEQI